MLAADVAHALRQLLVAQERKDSFGALLRGVDEIAGLAVDELERNAAHVARHHRPSFPQRFRDHQAEPFPHRFLDHNLRPLEGVYLYVADAVQVRENVNVVVLPGAPDGALVPGPALRIVVRHRGDED